MKFTLRQKFLAVALSGAMTFGLAGCSVSQFDTYLNAIVPAIVDILQIIAVAKDQPLPTAQSQLPAKIAADVSAVESLQSTFEAASAANKPGVQGQLNAAFTTLNSDLGAVEQLVNVVDIKSQQKVQLLVGLVESGVQLAEGLVSLNPNTPKLTPGQLVDSFNKDLVAKTGNAKLDEATAKMKKIHGHSLPIRVLSFGHAH